MSTKAFPWELGPFQRMVKPLLVPRGDFAFYCPVRKEKIEWAAKDLFNPGAVVRDGQVCLLVRAEDREGRFEGTSRIGLATSDNGFDFTLRPEPVIYPDNDDWISWEWEGGCEDPRVVESPDGGYVCLYSAFDGKTSVLFAASSSDLVHWQKYGPAFLGTIHARRWSKSGSIVTEVVDGKMVAARIRGKFWMYWGEGICFAAVSDDLLHWSPVEFDALPDGFLTYKAVIGPDEGHYKHYSLSTQRALLPLLMPRPGRHDSLFVEPGPPALKTADGIVLIYNGANSAEAELMDPALPARAYLPGQALFDLKDPVSCIARTLDPCLPLLGAADSAQVANVCFTEGLVLFQGKYRLYYGMGDSKIGCAVAEA